MSAVLPQGEYQVQEIQIKAIYLDAEFNCRGAIHPMDVVNLVKDIEKSGLQTPITVQPYDKNGFMFRCVAGHRRLTAFKVLKRETIPSFVRLGLSDLDARKINLKENLIRENLNPVQEAKAILPYLAASWTEQDIADEFEQSRGWVQIRKIVTQLPQDIQKEVAAGLLTQEQIRRLGGIRNKDEQYALLRSIKDHKERGEKIKLEKPVRHIAPDAGKHRNPSEIFAMNSYLVNLVGPSLGTRLLAWAAGSINDIELGFDIKAHCEGEGVEYVPHEAIASVMGQ